MDLVAKELDIFYNYKNKIMKALLTDEKLVHLIDEDYDFSKAKNLAYKQVFPCDYVINTVEEGKTFICFDVDLQQSANKTYFFPTIYVWVFAHKSKLRLSAGGIRIDKICSRIADLLNGSAEISLGELDLYSVKRYPLMTDFIGKVMTFHAVDFNRLYNPKKTVPANRRGG